VHMPSPRKRIRRAPCPSISLQPNLLFRDVIAQLPHGRPYCVCALRHTSPPPPGCMHASHHARGGLAVPAAGGSLPLTGVPIGLESYLGAMAEVRTPAFINAASVAFVQRVTVTRSAPVISTVWWTCALSWTPLSDRGPSSGIGNSGSPRGCDQ